ncbi:hypothetical protein Aduo_006264 [Ancylostoma duodenale]
MASNYNITLDILKSRYNNKMTTRHILFSQLANLPQCDHEGRNLQSLCNRICSFTRQFCAYEDYAKEPALGAILLDKQPPHVRSKVYDKTVNSHNLHCRATHHFREDGNAILYKPPNHKPLRLQEATEIGRHSQSSIHPSIAPDTPSPKLRVHITRDKKLCLNCLSSKHRPKECTSKRYCQTCLKRHHTSLCSQASEGERASKKFQRSARLTTINHIPRTKLRVFPTCGQHYLEQEIGATANNVKSHLVTSLTTYVLLICIEVDVFNANCSEKTTQATAFLDSGSS